MDKGRCELRKRNAERLAEIRGEANALQSHPAAAWFAKTALELIGEIEEGIRLCGTEDEVLDSALGLVDCYAAMRWAEATAKSSKSRQGLRKGSYSAYGSERQRDAAIQEWLALRSRIIAELPGLPKSRVYELIAEQTTSTVKGFKTIERALLKWDRRPQSQNAITPVPNRPTPIPP